MGDLQYTHFQVNYDTFKPPKTEIDFPGGPLPMVDFTPVPPLAPREPQFDGGALPFRAQSTPVENTAAGNPGRDILLTSADRPAFDFDFYYPNSNEPWSSTSGDIKWTEFVVTCTKTFPKNYVSLGSGDWILTLAGTLVGNSSWKGSATSDSKVGPFTTTPEGQMRPGDAVCLQVWSTPYDASLVKPNNGTTAPKITNGDLAIQSQVNKPIIYQITADQKLPPNGLIPPYQKKGSLPIGLNLNAQTGVISGTPTTTGTTQIPIRVVNTAGSDWAVLTITVTP
ncbi:MAG: putative Ig domain-containing protein [Terriglobia bacterium]